MLLAKWKIIFLLVYSFACWRQSLRKVTNWHCICIPGSAYHIMRSFILEPIFQLSLKHCLLPPQGYESGQVQIGLILVQQFGDQTSVQEFLSTRNCSLYSYQLLTCSPNNAAILQCREWKDTERKCSSEYIQRLAGLLLSIS